MNQLRKLYDWVLHWADTKYGMPALFFLAFAESSFFPIPPDVLLIALSIGNKSKAFRFALACSIGSIIGGIGGYSIGHFAWWSGEGIFSSLALFFLTMSPVFLLIFFKKYSLNMNSIIYLLSLQPDLRLFPIRLSLLLQGHSISIFQCFFWHLQLAEQQDFSLYLF